MGRTAWIVVSLLGLLAACAQAPRRADPVRLLLVGDSTIARVTGYGDALCARFDDAATCVNLARGGRSSKSYRDEGLWGDVLERLREPGFATTYVLIQFGHNDQPGKPGRSTTLPEFTANLQRYVREARERGAIPVLVTPLTRRGFRSGRRGRLLLACCAAVAQRQFSGKYPSSLFILSKECRGDGLRPISARKFP